MMQRAKVMSSAGLITAKQEVHDALNELETSSGNTQSVYTSLTNIYNALAGHPQAQLAVDSSLASQKTVQLLCDLVRLHMHEEEVQWVLGRVVALACHASIRFQCLAGQLEMWHELLAMRSTHPQSIRVQEASLRASESLFRSNEFIAVKLRPLLLLDDLLGIMDRFLRVQTPRRRAHQLVVLSLRVLVTLYSSPRPTGLLLFNGEGSSVGGKWASEISRRMLESFAVFNREVDWIRSWLDMVLLLLRQHATQTLESLFSPDTNKTASWWFVAVIERWQSQPQVMSSSLTTLTYIFALPHNTLADQEQIALAEKLIVEQNLMDVVCTVLDHYHKVTLTSQGSDQATMGVEGRTSSRHDGMMLVLLEAIRLVRQWSERPKLLPRLETSRSLTTTLLHVLIEQLHRPTRQPHTALSPKHLVFVLEALLVLRHLAASPTLRNALVISDKLQTSLRWLSSSSSSIPRPTPDSSSVARGTSSRSASTAGYQGDDGDLDALVARETGILLKLLAHSLDVALKPTALMRKGTQRRETTAIAVARKVEHVKLETLRAYR
ncbi:uncharacterized protein KRP23_9347 [Phytophthora ramorum]|uniref:uncharacterized protein n=1 Tax=Phytophthora ramorum TaxID=164328 RepID=UPI003095C28C|nr:hypothetical protein KRP23_9347 [Phytophthora ramorum]